MLPSVLQILVLFLCNRSLLSSVVYAIPLPQTEIQSGEWLSSAEISSFTLVESVTRTGSVEPDDGSLRCDTDESKGEPMVRNGITIESKLWKHFKYYLEGSYSNSDRRRIHVAVEILSQILPCVKFEELGQPLESTESHVIVQRAGSCSSEIGKSRWQQILKLDTGCAGDLKTILHEFIHALGLAHEQNRPDRDDYVIINWENVEKGQEDQFKKTSDTYFSTFGVAYNPKSVMHYHLNARSGNGKPTISLKGSANFAPDKPLSFGPFQYTGLQLTDVEKLRKMYKCG